MSLWGIANPMLVPLPYVTNTDIPCPGGTFTTVLSSAALSVPGPGNFYPIIWGAFSIQLSATPPSACTVGFNINGGATVTSQRIAPAMLVANALIFMPLVMVGVNSATAWVAAGSILNIFMNPTTNAVTWLWNGSIAIMALFRGLDA